MHNDNGYDEKGNKINDKGGDETDYLYRDGKIIDSKKVYSFTDDSAEVTSDYRSYGIKIHTDGTGFDWTWDNVKDVAISAVTVGTVKSVYFNSKVTVPFFRKFGGFIEKYAPSLNKGAGYRIGISKANIPGIKGTQMVFRFTYGNNKSHYFNIILGKWGK